MTMSVSAGGAPRVLLCLSNFYPAVGGTERQALALAQGLTRRHCNVTILTQAQGGKPRYEPIMGVPVHRAIRPLGRGSLYAASYLLTLLLFLIRHRRAYDIIHAHHLYLEAIVAGLVARPLGKRAVAKVANWGAIGDLARLRRHRLGQLGLKVFSRLDRCVAVSSQVREELLASGFRAAAVLTIPNGVDTARFRPAEAKATLRERLNLRGRTVTFVGRLVPEKGLDCLLRAWSSLDLAPTDVLLLAGDGPERAALENLARQLGIAGRVRFLGKADEPERILQASDLFVLPSFTEGMPNSLLEAMATGLPCIATRVGGIPDLIANGQNGLLVPPGDPKALAEAMDHVLGDPQGAARLGVEARRTVEGTYSIDRVAERYVALYRELKDSSNA